MHWLIIGSGGREHAIAKALVAEGTVSVSSLPGNPGMAKLGPCLAGDISDHAALLKLIRAHHIDGVIIGPEQPLVDGLADALSKAGVRCVGPDRFGAQLEASKTFTRRLGDETGVPQPAWHEVSVNAQVDGALATFSAPPVVKADGLAGGKGVVVPETFDEARQATLEILDGRFGAAGNTLVLEERMHGTEASLFFACAGVHCVALPHARDHKRLNDGQTGPNTGGMGAVSPNPDLDDGLVEAVRHKMVQPILTRFAAQGEPFQGFLFVGVMLTEAGPKLLEYNVRLGDPEAQAILPRLGQGEFHRLLLAMTDFALEGFELEVRPQSTCAVVCAVKGYPDAPERGDTIDIKLIDSDTCWVIHAGTRQDGTQLTTSGGRVLTLVTLADNADSARAKAYDHLDQISFKGAHYRGDIGAPEGACS